MAKTHFSLIILFILLAGIAHAQAPAKDTFSVAVTPINTKIAINETATFDITVSNGYKDSREFQLEKIGYPFWDMHTEPITNPITIIVPGESMANFTLYVRPLHITVEDTYSLDTYVVDLRTERKQLIPLTVGIWSTDALIQGYVPTVLTTATVPKSVDPREPIKILVNLNNQNALDYPNLTVRLSSNLVNGEFTYALGPREEKRVEIVSSIDPNTPPQQDRLVISLFRDGKAITNPLSTDFEVQEYLVKEEGGELSNLLRTQKKITLFSNNPRYEGDVREETSFFKSLFTSARPKASRVSEAGEKLLVWDIALDSNRRMEITIIQNYRPLVIIIITIFILITLYFVFRSPIVLIKEVGAVSIREGGISEVKIILRVRNRGKEPLSHIEVGDIVPPIATVEKEVSLGVLQPEKMISHKDGTIIKWIVPQLDSHEGVVLSYKMKSRLTILGDFHLPSATARCKSGNSYVITNSNRATVNG